MRQLWWFSALVVLIAPALAAADDRGRVAVVPPVNASGEKWQELKLRQCVKIQEWARRHLPAAGFRLVEEADVEGALRRLDLDMARSENWTPEKLLSVGQACGADYVLFAVVTFTEQKEQERIWYRDKEGRADVRVWLLDVRKDKALIEGVTFVGRSGGNRITIDNKGSERQIQAAANAVRDALRDFLAPYRAR